MQRPSCTPDTDWTRPRYPAGPAPAGTLPYGCWTLRDGSEVLFDRTYAPMWRRWPDGTVSRAEVRWYRWIKQTYFHDDRLSGRAATRRRLRAILDLWGVQQEKRK